MTRSLSLHDCLALGEIELGLSQSQNDNGDDNMVSRRKQEIQRLPLFLRILSVARPLTAVPTFDDGKTESKISEEKEKHGDQLVHRTVERLEDAAAKYSMAEEVDVVTSYLAPTMSRKISQLPPLQKTKEGKWDTKDLAAVARNPRSSKRKRRTVLSEGGEGDDDQDDYGIHESSADEEDEDAAADGSDHGDKKKGTAKKQRTSTMEPRDSEIAAAEDTHESTFVKTLSELASLVVAALAPLEESSHSGGGERTETTEGRSTKGSLSLTVDDSILNESTSGSGGAMEGSDLGATVAAIMCNASVLQSRHVAVSFFQNIQYLLQKKEGTMTTNPSYEWLICF